MKHLKHRKGHHFGRGLTGYGGGIHFLKDEEEKKPIGLKKPYDDKNPPPAPKMSGVITNFEPNGSDISTGFLPPVHLTKPSFNLHKNTINKKKSTKIKF